MGTLKSELEKAVPALTKVARKNRAHSQQPPPSIVESYVAFCTFLKDVSVRDPLGKEIVFRLENFPYLIKTERLIKSRNEWAAAKAGVVIEALGRGTFDEASHRCDSARSRGLLRIPEILKAPDTIHINIHPNVPGDFVYVIRVGADTYKLAFIIKNRAGDWVLVTSYYASGSYLKTCAKHPPVYTKTKGRRKAAP
jgi:hypothetical protein